MTDAITASCRSAAAPRPFTRRTCPAQAGDRRNGSFPLGATGPAITPPNHRFDVGMVKMPQPESAIEPGKGTVPVNPFLPSGATARVAGQVADEGKPK